MTKYSNKISTEIPQQDLNEILSAINFIDKKINNLVVLSEEEKSALPKMKVNTIRFVHECLEIAKNSPEVVPSDVEVDEIKKDVELVEAINQIVGPLKTVMKKLKHSTLLAESEAYLPSLAIYNAHQLEMIKEMASRDSKVKA